MRSRTSPGRTKERTTKPGAQHHCPTCSRQRTPRDSTDTLSQTHMCGALASGFGVTSPAWTPHRTLRHATREPGTLYMTAHRCSTRRAVLPSWQLRARGHTQAQSIGLQYVPLHAASCVRMCRVRSCPRVRGHGVVVRSESRDYYMSAAASAPSGLACARAQGPRTTPFNACRVSPRGVIS